MTSACRIVCLRRRLPNVPSDPFWAVVACEVTFSSCLGIRVKAAARCAILPHPTIAGGGKKKRKTPGKFGDLASELVAVSHALLLYVCAASLF